MKRGKAVIGLIFVVYLLFFLFRLVAGRPSVEVNYLLA